MHEGKESCNRKEFAVGVDLDVDPFSPGWLGLVHKKDQGQGQDEQWSGHVPGWGQYVYVEFRTEGKDPAKSENFVADE